MDTVQHRVVAQESHATFGGQPSMPTGAAAIVVTNNIIYDGGDGGHSVVSPGYLATTYLSRLSKLLLADFDIYIIVCSWHATY